MYWDTYVLSTMLRLSIYQSDFLVPILFVGHYCHDNDVASSRLPDDYRL